MSLDVLGGLGGLGGLGDLEGLGGLGGLGDASSLGRDPLPSAHIIIIVIIIVIIVIRYHHHWIQSLRNALRVPPAVTWLTVYRRSEVVLLPTWLA